MVLVVSIFQYLSCRNPSRVEFGTIVDTTLRPASMIQTSRSKGFDLTREWVIGGDTRKGERLVVAGLIFLTLFVVVRVA